MLKHRNRLLAAASVAVATAAVAVSGLTAASAAAPAAPAASGTEHFQLMINSGTANSGPVIATGLFTAGGVDHEGQTTGTFAFANGTIKVRHSPGRGPQTFNPRTCLFTLHQHGTYTIIHGTGHYAGIKGHGKYHINILAVFGRNSHGRCSNSAPPVAFELVINASGPVTLR